MIEALLSGKLSSNTIEMEDILTSTVFGALKYLDKKYFIEYIGESITKDYIKLNKVLNIKRIIDVKFWPMLSFEGRKRAEPDLLISLETSDENIALVCIEAKYNSKKSSLPNSDLIPNDQLAREYDNLVCLKNDGSINQVYLIYLTKDIVPPKSEIMESIKEYKVKRNDDINIYWLNWQTLIPIMSEANCDIFKDLIMYFKKLNMNIFKGIPLCEFNEIDDWQFFIDEREYKWDVIQLYNRKYKFTKSDQR